MNIETVPGSDTGILGDKFICLQMPKMSLTLSEKSFLLKVQLMVVLHCGCHIELSFFWNHRTKYKKCVESLPSALQLWVVDDLFCSLFATFELWRTNFACFLQLFPHDSVTRNTFLVRPASGMRNYRPHRNCPVKLSPTDSSGNAQYSRLTLHL